MSVIPGGPKYELLRVDPITGKGERVEHAKLSASLMRALGLEGSADTLRRLSRAGFIRVVKISPGVEQLDCASMTRHLEACEADPDRFDADAEATKKYLFRNALGGWKPKEKKWGNAEIRKRENGEKCDVPKNAVKQACGASEGSGDTKIAPPPAKRFSRVIPVSEKSLLGGGVGEPTQGDLFNQ